MWFPGCCVQYRNLTLVKCFIDHSGIKCCRWWNPTVDKTEFDSRHYIFGKWVRRIGWFTLTSISPTVPKLHVLITIYSSQDAIMPPNKFMISLIFKSISLTPIIYSNSNPQITHSLFNWKSSSIAEIYTTRMYFSNGNLQQNHSSHVADATTKNETPKLARSTGMKILRTNFCPSKNHIQDPNQVQTWKSGYLTNPTIRIFSSLNQNHENVSCNPQWNELPRNPKWTANQAQNRAYILWIPEVTKWEFFNPW